MIEKLSAIIQMMGCGGIVACIFCKSFELDPSDVMIGFMILMFVGIIIEPPRRRY